VDRNSEFLTGTQVKNLSNGIEMFHGAGGNTAGRQSGVYAEVTPPTGEFKDVNELAAMDENIRDYARLRHPDRDPEQILHNNIGSEVYPPEEMGQGVLFKDTRRGPTLDYLVATKDAKHLSPGVVATASQLARKRWGQELEPSTNLSSHSLPFVNRLIAAGMAKGEPIKEQGNYMDFDDAQGRISGEAQYTFPKYGRGPGIVDLPEGTVEQNGREAIRELLRREKFLGLTGNDKKTKPGFIDKASKKGSQFSAVQEQLPNAGSLAGQNLNIVSSDENDARLRRQARVNRVLGRE